MQRISYRLAAVCIAVALLILPVSVQAAPSTSDMEAREASFTQVFTDWLDAAWGAIEGVFLPPDTSGDDPTLSSPTTGGDTESNDDDKTVKPTFDPNG